MITAKPSHEFMRSIIEAYYAKLGNGAGGTLHIVLDDFNMEANHIEWCKQYAAKEGDGDGVFMAELLLQYTEEERIEIIVPDYLRDDANKGLSP